MVYFQFSHTICVMFVLSLPSEHTLDGFFFSNCSLGISVFTQNANMTFQNFWIEVDFSEHCEQTDHPTSIVTVGVCTSCLAGNNKGNNHWQAHYLCFLGAKCCLTSEKQIIKTMIFRTTCSKVWSIGWTSCRSVFSNESLASVKEAQTFCEEVRLWWT